MKKEYIVPECFEIGKLALVTQHTLQGDVPDGALSEDGDPDPLGHDFS